MAKKKYINTKDVVRMTGLTTNDVYALIHDGKLKAHKAPQAVGESKRSWYSRCFLIPELTHKY